MTDDDPTPSPHECRVYLDDHADKYAVIDEEDYQWAIQWRWKLTKISRANRRGKYYVVRTPSRRKAGQRRTVVIRLHIEIMKRTGKRRPSKQYRLVDHIDGDTMNNCRENLRWATHSTNSRNRK